MAVRSQLGCSVGWLPEQSLGLLPLHHVTGHRLQCTSAAIGPTAVHIGTDTVGSIRASACASKRPQLILRPRQQLRSLAMPAAIFLASSLVMRFAIAEGSNARGAPSSASTRLRLEIDIGHRKIVGVADDVANAAIFLDGPWWREAALGHAPILPPRRWMIRVVIPRSKCINHGVSYCFH
jgi:hypothetical protein